MNAGLILVVVGLVVDLICYFLNKFSYKKTASNINHKESLITGLRGGFIVHYFLWIVGISGAIIALIGIVVLLTTGG